MAKPPTPITPIRLSESDRAKLDAIRNRYGLTTTAETIRLLIAKKYEAISRKPR